MSGNLRDTWEYLGVQLWEPLADYCGKDANAPPDLFSDLFAAADEFLSPRATDSELEEARNDPNKARQRFLTLRGTDFASESAIVHFLEEADTIITDYEIPGFEDLYQRLLRQILRKFNLRYRLDEPFTIRFPGGSRSRTPTTRRRKEEPTCSTRPRDGGTSDEVNRLAVSSVRTCREH
jgi:hypothetical protein